MVFNDANFTLISPKQKCAILMVSITRVIDLQICTFKPRRIRQDGKYDFYKPAQSKERRTDSEVLPA